MHNGIDIAGGYGADIIAADSGTVLFSGNSSSYGKYIVISHGGGLTTLYAPLQPALSFGRGNRFARTDDRKGRVYRQIHRSSPPL